MKKSMPKLSYLKEKLLKFSEAFKIAFLMLKLFWKMNPVLFISSFVVIFIPAITPFVNAYIFKLVIDFVVLIVSGQAFDQNKLMFLFGLLLGTQIVSKMAFSTQDFVMKLFYTRFPSEVNRMVQTKLSTLDLQYFEDSNFRDLMQRVAESTGGHPQQLVYNFLYFSQSTLQVTIALVSLFYLSPILVFLIILVSLPTLINQLYFSEFSWGIYNRDTPFRKKHGYLMRLVQSRDSVKELRIFQTAEKFISEIYQNQREFYEKNKSLALTQFKVNTGFNILDTVVTLGILGYIIIEAASKRITIGDISYYQSVVSNFNNGIGGLFRNISRIFDESLYVKSIFEIMAVEPKITSPKNAIKIDFSKTPEIEFRNVSFKYPGAKRTILKDFSLIIKPGEKVAFVGENGAGKTTLVKILARFYDVDEGEILVDGVNVKQLDLESWRRTLGVLFQDFIRYEYPVADNIQFGKVWEKRDLNRIIDASKSAGAHEMVQKLDKTYEQMLGKTFEDGFELSGGQWQKVALARAFFRNAPVLILDEPTAAIDAKAEAEIFSRVEKLSKDKTVIIISHRFSTVRNADKIYVIENGRIKESGSHENLMKLDGQYAKLFNLQAKGYQ